MTRRRYGQYCALAKALDVVGERWTLLVVRELRSGPKRYSDLLANLPGVGTSLLAERLKHLEGEGVISRGYLPPPAASTVYELTEDGGELAEAIRPLMVWGARRLGKPARGEVVRLSWLMERMAAGCDEAASAGVRETYEFRLPQGVFHVRAEDGGLSFEEGPAAAPDLVLQMKLDTFIGLGVGGLDPAEEVAAGRMTVSGSQEAAANAVRILLPADEHAARTVARRVAAKRA